jgi:hypothetical protein
MPQGSLPQRRDENRRLLFLSYTTREADVKRLKAILDPFLQALPDYTWSRLGVWYDAVDIRHTSNGVGSEPEGNNSWLEREILDGLQRCDFTLAMISPHYMRSHWCRFEWRSGQQIHRPPTNLPANWKRTRYFRHYATWTDPYRKEWLDLCSMDPLSAAGRLLEEVVTYSDEHRVF